MPFRKYVSRMFSARSVRVIPLCVTALIPLLCALNSSAQFQTSNVPRLPFQINQQPVPRPAMQIDPATGLPVMVQPGQDPIIQLMMMQPAIDTNLPVVAEAEFDPPILPVGGRGVYRIVVTSANDSVTLPPKLPAPAGVELTPAGRSQNYHLTGGKMQPRSTINFHVRALAVGELTMPGYTVTASGKTLAVPAAKVSVVAAGAAPVSDAPRLVIEMPPGDIYVGMVVQVRVLLVDPGDNSAQGLSQVQVVGDTFFADTTYMRQRRELSNRNGRTVAVVISEIPVTPLREGSQPLIAQGYAIMNRNSTSRLSGIPSYNPLLDTEPTNILVKRVPTEGELPGYTGAIGTFQLEPPQAVPNTVRAGDPLTLKVTMRGEGNFGRFTPPRFQGGGDWQVFPPTSEAPPANFMQKQGSVTFTYTMIPQSDRVRGTPPIAFSYFDPVQKRHVDLTIPPVALKVTPAPNVAAAPASPSDTITIKPIAESADLPERELVMTGLAETPGTTATSLVPWQRRGGFVALQLLPGIALLGLWLWDRRSRYLQQHPEVILKRQARREISRQLSLARRAAAAQDAKSFVTAAVGALRGACAPHDAANPEALVCRDVLEELPTAARSGREGEVVRQIFAAADAVRFAGSVPDGASLLAVQPDLERLLAQLRTRL
jgi:hypothetical protein